MAPNEVLARAVLSMLTSPTAGLQWHQNGRWVPTHEGRKYAVIIPVQHASGRWHESLQWQKRVVPVLERRLARRSTLRSMSVA